MRRRLPRRTLAVALVALVPAVGCGGGDKEDRVVRVALNSKPNAVHAGVFTAIDRNLDGREGVRLRLREPADARDPLRLLDTGRADVAVADIHELARARDRGQNVVGVGAIVQRPLATVIARPGVRRPRELEGKRVGFAGTSSDLAVLKAIVQADGADPFKTYPVKVGFSGAASLAAGKVDALIGFWNTDGVALRRRGVRTREFRLDRYGAPRYPELVLAAQKSTLEDDPGLVRRTVASIRAGTRSAAADLPAAARSVDRHANGDRRLNREQLRAVAPAFTPAVRLRRRTLQRWADFDFRRRIVESTPDVRDAFALD